MDINSSCTFPNSCEYDEVVSTLHEIDKFLSVREADVEAEADVGAWDDHLDCDYERVLTIPLPSNCGVYPGGQSITVSMRELMTLLASAAAPDDRQHILEVRNCYFSGESDEDHYTIEIDHPQRSGDPESVAKIRCALENSASERERQRRDIEALNDAEGAAEAACEAALWAPVQEEKDELDAEWCLLDKRREILDREWMDAVAPAEAVEPMIDTCEATRAHLQGKSAELQKAFEDYHEKWTELRAKARALRDRKAA